MSGYKALYQPGEAQIIEKKSRFIAKTSVVTCEQEAVDFINACRKQYYDARHHCFAYVIGTRMEEKRFSDDGEPQGTAGKPILDVLERQEVTNAVIVVTRYFGGTLLGTGGLVRAYQQAAVEGLNASEIIERMSGTRYRVEVDYTLVGKMQYLLSQEQIHVMDTEYGQHVVFTILLPEEIENRFVTLMTNETSGTARVQKEQPVEYGIVQQKVILF